MPALAQRRTDLDGLRGVAILSVVAFHFDERLMPGGYAGVDIFFVLSGFLMARRVTAQGSKRSLLQFFARRLQRLVPALAVCLAAVTIAAAFIFGPSEFDSFGQRLSAMSIFAGNILFWAQSGYFAPESKSIELLHLWSLGAEGQWYLFVPALYFLLRLFQSPRWENRALILLTGLSCAFALYCSYYSPSFGFYMFPARLWQFLLGAIVATCLPPFDLGKSHRYVSGIGLALVLAPMAFWPVTGSFSFELVLLVSLGTAILVASGLSTQRRSETGILHWPVLTFAGRISYSWYLWHWPLLTLPPLFFMQPLSWVEKLAAVLAAAGAATLSTFRLELPILSKPILSAPRVIVGQLSLMVGFLAAGGMIAAFHGFPQRVSAEAARADYAAMDFQLHESCAGTPKSCDTQNWSIVVWGDSHAEQWIPAISEIASGAAIVRLGGPGCPPLPGLTPLIFSPGQKPVVSTRAMMAAGNCRLENQAALDIIEARADVKTVVLAAAWSFYSEGVELQTGEGRYLVQKASDTLEVARSRKLIQEGLGVLITRLRARGKTVWLIGDTPAYRVSPPICLSRSIMFNRDQSACSATGPGARPLLWSNAILTSFAEKHQVRVILPSNTLCGPNHCALKYRGHYLYHDADHITSTAARVLARDMFKMPEGSAH